MESRLENTWKSAKEMRNKILTNNAYQLNSSPKIDASLLARELGIEFEHLTFHDLKRKGELIPREISKKPVAIEMPVCLIFMM